MGILPNASLTAPSLQWRHSGHDSVSNHQPHDCLLNRLFRRRSKKISKLCVTGLCAGNSPETGEFPAQMASNAENVSIWWRHPRGGGGVLGQVLDRDAPHRPLTRNATRIKKGGRNYTFFPILMKNRGRNTTFSSFLLKYRGQNTTFSSCLLKYRGRNSTNFPETWKRGVETEEHI